VINLFKSILNIDNVDVEDDYFDLGGHSLLILKLLQNLHTIFNVDINIEIF